MHTNPEVLALVALGERDAASAEELDHIARCAACGQEVTDLGHLSQVGRTISDHFTLETPSPEVWDRIRAQLGFDADFSSDLLPPTEASALPPLTLVRTTDPEPTSGPERQDRAEQPRLARRRVLSLALAAVLALLAGVGGTLAWQQLRPGAETVISAVPLNALPAWSGAGGEATLEQDADGRRWLVVKITTGRPVDGVQQVWLMNRDASAMTPVGLMARDDERFPVPNGIDVSRYPVVDVSDEEPGGAPTHSGNSIVRGTLAV